MNITSGSDLTLDEMTEATDRIHQEVGDDAEIIWGQTFDDELKDEMHISIISVFDKNDSEQSSPPIFRGKSKLRVQNSMVDLWINPGKSTRDDLIELFSALSELHRANGGIGLSFVKDDDDSFLLTAREVA